MDVKRLAFAVAPVLAAALVGGVGSRNAAQVYGRLRKPSWAPPASVFGPVWTTLYGGIGFAGWRLYPAASQWLRTLHLVQLALNAAWSPTFFGVRDKRASLVVISALDSAVAAEVMALRRTDPTAAALLVPYLAWSGFATALNVAVSDPGVQL